jgi:hypothetical protein
MKKENHFESLCNNLDECFNRINISNQFLNDITTPIHNNNNFSSLIKVYKHKINNIRHKYLKEIDQNRSKLLEIIDKSITESSQRKLDKQNDLISKINHLNYDLRRHLLYLKTFSTNFTLTWLIKTKNLTILPTQSGDIYRKLEHVHLIGNNLNIIRLDTHLNEIEPKYLTEAQSNNTNNEIIFNLPTIPPSSTSSNDSKIDNKYELHYLPKERLFFYTKTNDRCSLHLKIIDLKQQLLIKTASQHFNSVLTSVLHHRLINASKYGYHSKFIVSTNHLARVYVDNYSNFHLQLFDDSLRLVRTRQLNRCLMPYQMNDTTIILYSFLTFNYICFDYFLDVTSTFSLCEDEFDEDDYEIKRGTGGGDSSSCQSCQSALSLIDASLVYLTDTFIYAIYYPSRLKIIRRRDNCVERIIYLNGIKSYFSIGLVRVDLARNGCIVKEEYSSHIRWYDLTSGQCIIEQSVKSLRNTTTLFVDSNSIYCLDNLKNQIVCI